MAVTINGSGKLISNVVSTTKTNKFTTTSTSYVTVTGLTATITPSSTSSKILVMFNLNSGIVGNAGGVQIRRGSTPIGVGQTGKTHQWTCNNYNGGDDANSTPNQGMMVLDSPSTTSAVTYSIAVACVQGGGTQVINDQTSQVSGTSYSGYAASTITVMEVSG